MALTSRRELSIAVLVPCYNEEQTIAAVVLDLRAAVPGAVIYVFDNNSHDLTALRARSAGAVVVREPRQGKGNVVRRMFADIDADIYLLIDGDGTYSPADAPLMINTLLTERCDMVVGTRRGVTQDAGRAGHAFGNMILTGSTSACSGPTSPTSSRATAPSAGASSRVSPPSRAASRSRPR